MPQITVDVPQDVLDEFETSLSKDIEVWTEAVKQHSQSYKEEEDVDKANEDAKSSGIMIACFLPKNIAEDIAVENGEELDELHLTLLYLGKANQYTEEQIEGIKSIVETLSDRYAPLQGEIGGQGRFPASGSSDDYDVVIRLVDVPRIELLREYIIAKLRTIGIDPVLNHGYTAHVTLAYVGSDYQAQCTHPEPIPFNIHELTVNIGEERFTYPLNGEEVLKVVGPTQASVHIKPLSEEEELEKGEEEAAPDYRKSDSNSTCSNCNHSTAGRCDLYDFKYKKGWVCDEWEAIVAKSESANVTLSGEILKSNKSKQLVFGWASIVEHDGKVVVDKQGDTITEEELEKMAYEFVLTSREAGEMHERIGVGKLVESIVLTKEKQKALGINIGKVGWFVGFKVTDPNVWKKIESGEYGSFSIHGKGIREKIA